MNDDILFEPYHEEPPRRKKRRGLKIILIILICLCGFAAIWVGVPYFLAFNPFDDGSTSQGVGLVVDLNATEIVEPTPSPGIAIPGFESITIPANTKTLVGINLQNPKENSGWYYLTYKICLLDDRGRVTETLYTSNLIPPNSAIKDITLSRGLAPGEYDAVMQVQPYRIADMTPTNNADLKMTIIVK